MANRRSMTTSEKEQAATLLASGLSFNAIGKDIGRDPKTVKATMQKPDMVEKVEEKKVELADMYETLSRRMVDSITDADITKINAYQRTVASGIATDKARLLRGQSTINLAAIYSRALEDPGGTEDTGE